MTQNSAPAQSAPSNLLDYLHLATDYLQRKGVNRPRLDAELLLAYVLGLERVQIYTQFDRPLEQHEVERYRSFLSQRAQKEPIAYIVGEKEFFGYPFYVNSHVLIPRPETEHLVEAVIDYAETSSLSWLNHRVLDMGTGSGCIGATLALEIGVPEALVLTDISKEALQLARHNLDRLGLTDGRIELRHGDLWQPVAQERFHLIVANPPYIDEKDRDTLMEDVLQYEPGQALFSAENGRYITRKLIAEGKSHLYSGGYMFIEIHEKYAEYWREYATNQGWAFVHIAKDLAGKPRLLRLQSDPDNTNGK